MGECDGCMVVVRRGGCGCACHVAMLVRVGVVKRASKLPSELSLLQDGGEKSESRWSMAVDG